MLSYKSLSILSLFIGSLLLVSCGNNRLDDFSDVSFELTNQNGESVTFPDDYEGAPVVVGFIYTNCPDICSFITSNVQKIYEETENPGDTQFVLITFDPERDTPEALKKYASAFEMDTEPFHFLTGDTETIDALMKRVSVRTSVDEKRETETGRSVYFINHSDKILLIDQHSRLVFDYGGSMTPTEIIAEDLNKL
ncbi:MAG: SCO family protein [Balneolaceae bacterium]